MPPRPAPATTPRRTGARAPLTGDIEHRIVEAARYCFRTIGIERTRMDDVAGVVGIARPNLYRYVGGKDALIRLVVMAETRKTDEIRRRVIPIDGPVGPLLVESLTLGVELALEDDFLRQLTSFNVGMAASLIVAPEGGLPRPEYWYPIFDHGRQRGELRSDLDNADLLRWIGLMSIVFIERRELFPDTAAVRWHAERFVVPAFLASSDSPLDPQSIDESTTGRRSRNSRRLTVR